MDVKNFSMELYFRQSLIANKEYDIFVSSDLIHLHQLKQWL